jgi:DNA-binding response OmpR family regulator
VADLLLVDNDPRLASLLAWYLESRGHTVRGVHSFVQARAALAERRPDLLLSDLELGPESAREELPALALEGLLPPTLIVSGYLDPESSAALRAVPGVVGLLAKPFELAVLEARVAECLARARELATGPAGDDDGWVEIEAPRRREEGA